MVDRIEKMVAYFDDYNLYNSTGFLVRVTFLINLVEVVYPTGEVVASGRGRTLDEAIDQVIVNLNKIGFL